MQSTLQRQIACVPEMEFWVLLASRSCGKVGDAMKKEQDKDKE